MESVAMPGKRRYVVAVEWIHEDVQDVDEVAVWSVNASAARATARKRWQKVVAPKWPGIKIVRTFTITKKMLRAS
jgi:hypothetical protein